MSGGLLVMALTATAIASNAMFLQNGRHPDPLFKTRPTVAREAPRTPAPVVAVQTHPGRGIVAPPIPRPAPHRVPESDAAAAFAPSASVPAIPATQSSGMPIVAEIQRGLARVGLYSGAIDGVTGSRTDSAIRAFQTAAGLTVTGIPSPELLAALKQPVRPATQTAVAPGAGTDALAAELDRRERQRAEMIAAQEREQAASRTQANYRIAEAALNRIGYGPLSVDGAASAASADAIRRFELDNGMPITGEASDALIARLAAIGAVRPD